jgi:hypothetical protein
MLTLGLKKVGGAIIFLLGIYVGLFALFGDERWQQSLVVRCVGVALAWAIASSGAALYKGRRVWGSADKSR